LFDLVLTIQLLEFRRRKAILTPYMMYVA